ncbi:hypothetical protein COCMIDRAFT_101691 [Bipolaris oryzae ATCC 44560]|uniref:Zn(2)-C6 fungal-type domain-containing protein n=1 Tax=Bipolaris oryzae ATCC 44560 TaxID=930090 RepID=W6ZHU2_COCMI|nr:uncharacterized protein COCMIDRAFT_101691 [Bipolaris oryzae ATCC 44560]EUC43131.1 hypothetical protein COCMIDRAFT_101691 [Bipolaris oryzae ATCC 44560]
MASAQAAASSSGGADEVPPAGNSGSASNPKMRKRTKTGCLTCRKRRIKCGEERPTCANCIKSKRQCEGYNQRVIFKPPMGDWPNHPGVVSTIQYHTSMLPGTRNQPYRGPEPSAPISETTLTSIQPRPIGNFDFQHVDPQPGAGPPPPPQPFVGGNLNYTHEQTYQPPLHSPPHQQPLISPHHQAHTHPSTVSYFPQQSPVHISPPEQLSQGPNTSPQQPLPYNSGSSYPPVSVPYSSDHELKPVGPPPLSGQQVYSHAYRSDSLQDPDNAYQQQSSVSPQSDQFAQNAEARPGFQRFNSLPHVALHSSQPEGYNFQPAISHTDFSYPNYSAVPLPYDMNQDVKHMPQPVLEEVTHVQKPPVSHPQLLLSGFGGEDHASPTQVLDEAAVEYEDDDYWDVHSDEDMIDAETGEDENALLTSQEFSAIRRIHLENSNELGIRRYDAFLYDGLLSHYKPEYAASPLRNPKTARVFAHFIHVTAPTLSIFERNPRDPTLIFEGATPPSQQGLWTYKLPLKALNHQGLLHAMLALASLHIARLQGASVTPSYKHYAYSLKRLVRSLSHPTKRLSMLTLANSLLLAWYEVWTAEHVKWGTHVVGAQQLITELDFRSLTREARRMQAAQTAMERQFPYQNPAMLIDQRQFDQKLKESSLMPDQNLVSTIVGNKVNYDDFGMIFEDDGARYDTKPSIAGGLDLNTYATLQDLFWSFARHDVFQSIISGSALIHPYHKWSDCPPRSPLGRLDALYGSHDHLLLLLGRVADFTVKDRPRKVRQVEADGGWQPRPGIPGPPPGWKGPPPSGFGPSGPSQGPPSQGPPSQAGPPPSGMPSFYGMAPAPTLAPQISSYENPNFKGPKQTPDMPQPKYDDLSAAYANAVAEWESICEAHAAVERVFQNTEGFAPLPEDIYPPPPGERHHAQSNMTPFGKAISHRSYDISILWTLLYLAKIILLRSHPGMPPAAQMAAGVCAAATAPYCTLIGRITAGFQIPISEDLSPFLGAIFTEATMSMFFAGVTFKEPHQREWLITRLLEIERRIGWASAGMIAKGCESVWEQQAKMKRGPPYVRRTKRTMRFKEEEGYVEDPEYTNPRGPDGPNNDERRKWVRDDSQKETRFVFKSKLPPWAMNVLSTEEDLRVGLEKVGL